MRPRQSVEETHDETEHYVRVCRLQQSRSVAPTTTETFPPITIEDGRQEREEKVLTDARTLEPLLNSFWSSEFQNLYTITFDPPERFEYYYGADNKPCGGQSFIGANNAYYCSAELDEYVAFDMDWFQGYLINAPGGATTFLILAHEWGHAVQDSWLEAGGQDVWNPQHLKELNADCVAGVFLAWGINSGNIMEEAGDAETIWSWLYEAGGPWLDPGTYGTSEQRIAAFTDGFHQGTDACRRRY